MKYIRILAAALVLLCTLCACTTPDQPPEPQNPQTQTGSQYQSSWITGLSKSAVSNNPAVADWLLACAGSERDDIAHYVLQCKVPNADGTTTYHLLLYRSAPEFDAASFTVNFALDGNLLTVTPSYTSSDKSEYGYDLVYLTLVARTDLRVSVELLVDGDYPGQIVTTVQQPFTPDSFGVQNDE